MRTLLYLLIISALTILFNQALLAQEDEEPVLYFQMEPLDDSLFIHIQQELFIDPPDPKAEIVVDIREPNNSTISVKGALYPFLALKPETRALITTYPFKINLEETIHFGSLYTRVLNKLRFEKILVPPSVFQISPSMGYINPYVQVMGGERFGIPLKKDVGISVGLGTPYSGALETNFVEANFHILGFRGGVFRGVDAMVEVKSTQNHNNLYVSEGFQVAYVIPFGNFLEVGYTDVTTPLTSSQIRRYTKDNLVLNADSSVKYGPYLLDGSFINWETRYPVKVLGSTRGKFYVAQFLDEWHIGYFGREHALAGSVFDFRFDAMISSKHRQPSYACDISVQKIFDYWAFSSIAIGPSFILTTLDSGSLGFSALFFNMRIKVGSSL